MPCHLLEHMPLVHITVKSHTDKQVKNRHNGSTIGKARNGTTDLKAGIVCPSRIFVRGPGLNLEGVFKTSTHKICVQNRNDGHIILSRSGKTTYKILLRSMILDSIGFYSMSLYSIRRSLVAVTAIAWLLADPPFACAFLNNGCSQCHRRSKRPFLVRPYSKSSALNENFFSNMFKNIFTKPKPADEVSENIQSLEESQAEMIKFLDAAEQALDDADALLQSLMDDNGEEKQGNDEAFVISHRPSRNDDAEQPVQKFEAGHDMKDIKRDWSTSTVAQLKDELRSRGLPVSGRKTDLISRLGTFTEVVDDKAEHNNIAQHGVNFEDTTDDKDCSSWTVAQLKVELKSHGLSVSGKKADLISRLAEVNHGNKEKNNLAKITVVSKGRDSRETPNYEDVDNDGSTNVAVETDWSSSTVAQLKVELKSHGLPVSGKKADLISRLVEANPGNQEKNNNLAKITVVSKGRNGRTAPNYEEANNEDSTTVAVETDWTKLTVPQLKVQLKSRGLPVSGKKAALISRLAEL